ncbi:DUF4421 domain-containing protein [Algoriphagus jejuensis]|uniref:DUF4421 domain-containing protein n=1 Tax=Algoriphagus jejuensis TaxID=419934 RepID=UPI0031D240CC
MLLLFFTQIPNILFAQIRGLDTAYIEPQSEKMILRTYVSKKYTAINYGDPVGVYEPNSGLNLGVGVTYQKFTLNMAFPVSFLNQDRQEDWPKFLDLQAHIYPQSWVIDLFGQFYNGYLIKDYRGSGEDYLRRDIKVVKLGVGASYIFNGEKISLEAAFHQSAIQKKSAFSTMAGFEVYRVRISGDSLVIPQDLAIPGNYTRADFYQVGPSGGVVGTLVLGKGFFLTGAASANVGLGFSKADQDKETTKFEVTPGYFLRGFAGYNGNRFSINGSYVYKHLDLAKQQDVTHSANTGNYRINLVYKISPGPKLVKTYTKLNPLNILRRLLE